MDATVIAQIYPTVMACGLESLATPQHNLTGPDLEQGSSSPFGSTDSLGSL